MRRLQYTLQKLVAITALYWSILAHPALYRTHLSTLYSQDSTVQRI